MGQVGEHGPSLDPGIRRSVLRVRSVLGWPIQALPGSDPTRRSGVAGGRQIAMFCARVQSVLIATLRRIKSRVISMVSGR
jgi:hypothetical protein